jgi:hypothetical protein
MQAEQSVDKSVFGSIMLVGRFVLFFLKAR